MKIRFLTLLTTLVFLGFTVTAFAAKPVCPDGSCNGNETLASCPEDCGDVPPTPDPTPDPTTLTQCEKYLCLASVDKWDRPAARSYVEDTFGSNGSYTKIPPKVFGDILAALSEG